MSDHTGSRGHCDFDDAWIERDTLVVRGRARPGHPPDLRPRRYKSRPDWAVVDIVSSRPTDEVPNDGSAATTDLEDFRLTCALGSIAGRLGVCVAGQRHRRLVPLQAAGEDAIA